MFDGSTIFAEDTIAELWCEGVEDAVKSLTVDRVEYRVQSFPIYYGVIVMVRSGKSRAEEGSENECLFDEKHGCGED